MDIKYNKPAETSTTSLHGLYTDFDGWVTRSTCFSQEISPMDQRNNANQNDAIIEKDYFFRNILARQRYIRHSAKRPPFSPNKDNESFMFYDHVLYGLINKNGDRRIYYQLIRSKL